ncbi:cob(I)yrinic acid a,c-diamide adenosyltransferase [Anaerolentibacter hominis]|uniref:cob(I)yrinic acid a,c-diamide adenosyltransferase n=1 Tax=Anaerolentibacter hominis TaxID=3079009 RepID=UPI0031B8A244
MIHVYCGDGKGKTTAAMGLALRMAGYGRPVLVLQFMKGRFAGEIEALKRFSNVYIYRNATDLGFSWEMGEKEREQARQMHDQTIRKAASRIAKMPVFLVVMDEIFSAYQHDMVSRELVQNFVEAHKRETELVLTGRDPDPYFVDMADYITEMKKIRHPYEQGIQARKGIEY